MKYKDRLNIWLENYIKPTAKRRTYESYSLIAEQHIKARLGDEELSEILWHKSPTITLNRYAHSMTEHKREMMNKLGKML